MRLGGRLRMKLGWRIAVSFRGEEYGGLGGGLGMREVGTG